MSSRKGEGEYHLDLAEKPGKKPAVEIAVGGG